MTELAYPSGLSRSLGVVSLQSIVDCLTPREVHRFRHLGIEGLAFYSGEVQKCSLFFAIHGTRHNCSMYAAEAVRRGAVATQAPWAEKWGDGVARALRPRRGQGCSHYVHHPTPQVHNSSFVRGARFEQVQNLSFAHRAVAPKYKT